MDIVDELASNRWQEKDMINRQREVVAGEKATDYANETIQINSSQQQQGRFGEGGGW